MTATIHKATRRYQKGESVPMCGVNGNKMLAYKWARVTCKLCLMIYMARKNKGGN